MWCDKCLAEVIEVLGDVEMHKWTSYRYRSGASVNRTSKSRFVWCPIWAETLLLLLLHKVVRKRKNITVRAKEISRTTVGTDSLRLHRSGKLECCVVSPTNCMPTCHKYSPPWIFPFPIKVWNWNGLFNGPLNHMWLWVLTTIINHCYYYNYYDYNTFNTTALSNHTTGHMFVKWKSK